MVTVDDETILEVLRSNDAPRMTTTEVAGHLPVTRGTTRTRLQGLVDEGLLERTTEGNDVVWWLPEREAELGVEEESTESEAETEAETAETEVKTAEAETTDAEAADARPAAETEVEVTATEESTAETESGPTAVEVEAVGDDEPAVETPDPATETRSTAERDDEGDLPELSDDEEGLRALATVAVVLVAVLLFRKLLGGD